MPDRAATLESTANTLRPGHNGMTAPAADESSGTRRNAPFVWGVGIECSFLPHIDVDQFEWTQHDRFWKEDLRRVRETLGVTHLRYAMPWHKIEREPGQFDFASTDERIAFAGEIGLELMMDVMHFGTPKWLGQAVGDPLFPEALERFSTAMVERYRGQITTWCPFNEPLVSALFSGDFGFWPPYSRKWRGYMPVLSRIATAVSRSIAAIRRAQPEATVLLCDAFENFQTRNNQLDGEVALRNLRRFVMLDLIGGRVDPTHPLYTWLTSFGFSELDLEHLRQHPQMPDLIGLDYYPHSDWQLEMHNGAIRQRRADAPLGIQELATAVYNRYGLPMMVTETSIEGQSIAREIWLDTMLDGIKQLREEGVPMTGLIWWPAFDQIDWDGALRHRIGKLHRVGLFTLDRQPDGSLKRSATPLAKRYQQTAAEGDEAVGELKSLAVPAAPPDLQLPPLLTDAAQWQSLLQGVAPTMAPAIVAKPSETAPGLSGEPAAGGESSVDVAADNALGRYGIIVFSHLRWGFVWQRPQQFLSRFARHHPVLFIEEPFFDLPAGAEPRLDLHRVLPNVTVVCAHCAPEMASSTQLAPKLREWVRHAIDAVNVRNAFDRPLLWYYSPMDSAWSLGHFANRGVVYDSMDELSQFTGAPPELVANEARLMKHSDIVFTGGMNLRDKKAAQHPNVQFYGCGVEFDHFNKAQDPATSIPPDVDFMNRPIIGWFGVVDERVDYHLLDQIARMRPDWNLAIVGPVVKVDPNLLPHSPNLHWLGGRDYQVLPNYCRAFDVCMMCFAINKATEFINPTKALEYLATGKPVVSTPVKDVINQYQGLLEIARTPEEFVEAIDRCLHHPDAARIEKGLELARQNSWEGTVRQMRQNIADAVGVANRRSSSITPIDDPAPGYFFRHTPGS